MTRHTSASRNRILACLVALTAIGSPMTAGAAEDLASIEVSSALAMAQSQLPAGANLTVISGAINPLPYDVSPSRDPFGYPGHAITKHGGESETLFVSDPYAPGQPRPPYQDVSHLFVNGTFTGFDGTAVGSNGDGTANFAYMIRDPATGTWAVYQVTGPDHGEFAPHPL